MRLTHIAWNFGGLALPLIVAALTVPKLLAILGPDRFGLLALAWGLIGYASVLDLGMGRALTQMVSRLLGEGKRGDIPAVLATASRLTLIAGMAGGLAIGLAAFMGADAWVKTTTVAATEIVASMVLLAIALPTQAMSATYRGMNEAYLNFRGISLLRAGLGVVNFGGPYLIAQLTRDLPWLVASLVLSRLLAFFVFRHLALTCISENQAIAGKAAGSYSTAIAKSLFSFGGWVTVSGVVSPVLVQADRFVIAASMSTAAVSVYVLPYELVVQSLIIVGAVSSVMFPSLSRLIRENNSEWKKYFRKCLWRVAALMAIVCGGLALLLPYVLSIWIKESLNPQSVVVGQILCVGVFFNAVASMFYAALHASGRADMTAKIHLVELPLFLALLIFLIDQYGLNGAACAWVARMGMDALALGTCMKSCHG